jgi:hypothetical protein
MQGVFTGTGGRFKTKKSLKEAVANGDQVVLEATSFFGNEYDGSLADAPDGRYDVVGPDPHVARNWYANIDVKNGAASVR